METIVPRGTRVRISTPEGVRLGWVLMLSLLPPIKPYLYHIRTDTDEYLVGFRLNERVSNEDGSDWYLCEVIEEEDNDNLSGSGSSSGD